MTTRRFLSIAFTALAFLALACTTKPDDHHHGEGEQTDWKQMDDFHMIMAETFHPYKDSANLEPVRSRATELAASAEKWAGSELPRKVDNGEMKDRLEALEKETAALVRTVSSGNDQAIADQLTRVHDLFHAIQEAWYTDGDGQETYH